MRSVRPNFGKAYIMNRFIRCGLAAALCSAVMPALLATPAFAHGYAGKRFFPATITTDDPFVADELSLPTVSYIKNNDEPSAKETEVSAEFSKRILDNLGLSFEEAWTHLDRPHEQNKSGFQNLETAAKYQFLTSAEHEAIVSAGLGVEWGDTGARKVDADSFSTLTPTLFFGKGAGDLPESLSLARPLALTGVVGYAVPTSGRNTKTSVDPDTGEIERDIDHHPTKLVYGFAVEYSMPYLQANVRDFGLPDFANRLIPVVEFSFETPTDHRGGEDTTGFINPGIIWAGQLFQVGVEAVIPANTDSGRSVGIIGQLHFYLDDLFPTTIGKPIF
jgi:hypothetical protein